GAAAGAAVGAAAAARVGAAAAGALVGAAAGALVGATAPAVAGPAGALHAASNEEPNASAPAANAPRSSSRRVRSWAITERGATPAPGLRGASGRSVRFAARL